MEEFKKKNNYPSNNGFRGNSNEKENATTLFNRKTFKDSWIKEKADVNMVEYAECMGKFMAKNGLTNSKIRSIYGEIKRIQMGTFEKEESAFLLLKPKVAYAMGRDERNEGLKLFKSIFDVSSNCVKDQKTFNNFCNFIEAIIAYHKAYGGKD